MVTSEQVHELAQLGVVASVQPVFDAWWGGPDGLYEARLGGRAKGMNPYDTMLKSGMTMAFGSDSPVTPMEPWLAVRAAVHHHDPAQRIDVRAAIDAHTAGGWSAAEEVPDGTTGSDGSDQRKGRLGGEVAVGAPAYLAVWSTAAEPAAEPARPDLEALVAPGRELPRCDLTIVAGRAAHDALHEWPEVSTGSTSERGAR